MKYDLPGLHPTQFESLVHAICGFLLGDGVQRFTDGPDGGRDAKFVGTALRYPSERKPWKGTTIIQAKHTNAFNASFSDPTFYSETNASSVLAKELPKIRSLRKLRQLDNYMLFSNRSLTGLQEENLVGAISSACGLKKQNVRLCGVHDIEGWVAKYPQIEQLANIHPFDAPLVVDTQDLAAVVEHLAIGAKSVLVAAPSFDRVSYNQKNVINKMSEGLADYLRRNYLAETSKIDSLLHSPDNESLRAKYADASDDFQIRILSKMRDSDSFDAVFDYLERFLLDRDTVLARYKRLTRAVLFYMYWRCDLGRRVSDESA